MTTTSDRIAIVTGASSGIGRVTAQVLAGRGMHVVLACRSEEKAHPVVAAIRDAGGSAELVVLDLGSLSSVRDAAESFLASDRPLHLLINNAGVGGQVGITDDGFELNFGVNHLGHFLLTNLLLDRMRASSPARIVNVSSKSHYRAKGLDWAAARGRTRGATGLEAYAQSKLCNVLHAAELARRLDGTGINTYSLHPGVVATNVWRRVPRPFAWVIKQFMLSNEEGARTTIHCATSDAVAQESGRYYDNCRERTPSRLAQSRDLAAELWKRSASWVD